MRPVDECTYPKPFPDEFAACPAYQARQYPVPDGRGEPHWVWTCRHLQSKERADVRGSFYAVCTIGDVEARVRWAEQQGVERLARIAQLRATLAPIVRPVVERLVAAKARQLSAVERQQQEEEARATAEMRQVAAEYLRDLERFLSEHKVELIAADLAPESLLELSRYWSDAYIRSPYGQVPLEAPPEMLERFPQPVRDFYATPRTDRLPNGGR